MPLHALFEGLDIVEERNSVYQKEFPHLDSTVNIKDCRDGWRRDINFIIEIPQNTHNFTDPCRFFTIIFKIHLFMYRSTKTSVMDGLQLGFSYADIISLILLCIITYRSQGSSNYIFYIHAVMNNVFWTLKVSQFNICILKSMFVWIFVHRSRLSGWTDSKDFLQSSRLLYVPLY